MLTGFDSGRSPPDDLLEFPRTSELMLADAGYWHQDQMQRIVADGIQC
jgi:hypothetical protein